MAVDAEHYFAMYPEYKIPPDQWQAFMQDMQGAVIGRKLADKFGWKIGDKFYLESFIPPYRKSSGPFEFVVRAIFDADPAKHPGTDTNLMFFHFKYLYEGTGRRIPPGTYTIEIDDPVAGGGGQQGHRRLFENSDAQTHTETEQAFAAGFISMAGNLALLLNSIGLAVSFTILLVTANTMSMAVRERRTEIAVLKTLGFSSGQVMGLVVAEAVLLGALGRRRSASWAARASCSSSPSTPGHQGHPGRHGPLRAEAPPVVAALGFAVRSRAGLRRRLRAGAERLPRRASPTC